MDDEKVPKIYDTGYEGSDGIQRFLIIENGPISEIKLLLPIAHI